ncbi:MAG: hypothetical protein EOO29_12490 [Comamonadaceae bacterium]|nr:MAG: hypothetical protein EOO29_12490 [Comamonadaceae bacterium]
MHNISKESALATSGTQGQPAPSLGHEYRLSAPLDLEFGEFGDSAAMPLELLDDREMKALQQWQHSLLALRHAISGRR